MLVVFRDTLASGFDLGFGDRMDAMIEMTILEHWRSVFLGAATWNQPLYFHPYADTLGYNDGYFLSGLIYSAWRLGFEPFLSDTLTAFTFRTLGYVATLWLVRGVLRWSWGLTVLIATLATISNGMFLHAGHAQINTLALLPLVAGLATLTVRAEIAGRPRARLLAVATAAVIGVWLVSAFYFAWFTLYFSLVLLLCWLGVTGRWRPAAIAALVRAHGRTLATFALAFTVAVIPFLFVYVAKRVESGGHGFMISYLVQPTDLVNVGEANLLWGWLVQGLRIAVHAVAPPDGRLARALLGGEHESGFPLLLFALACAALVRLVARRGDTGFARVFALAILISWALTLRIWQVSPWLLVHFLVPGASGLRVVLRYQLFLVLPVLLLIGIAWRAQLAQLWQRRPWIAGAIVALLLAEQVNLAQPARLSRSAQHAALDTIPAPPPGCSAFYIVSTRPGAPLYRDARLDALYPHNVDAMFLAERWRVPTINGFSTFTPPDWNFAAPLAPDYDARVRAYAQRHGLTGLCRLDMRAAQPWSRG
ncbi:hypothetical protein TS85_09415 [Sphingomonas hengshuiensis]|uniref:Glycosyltransferase RgtA/B/C/D-like domain-containing protein n=2 Tax=Sphingomonas hengshuiensis TaxID=1609977 RepID=A0A7U5CV32_9SPHN|nr:hypothetical protein TS85_09415 [Sphingomonas hengshuiensis]